MPSRSVTTDRQRQVDRFGRHGHSLFGVRCGQPDFLAGFKDGSAGSDWEKGVLLVTAWLTHERQIALWWVVTLVQLFPWVTRLEEGEADNPDAQFRIKN